MRLSACRKLSGDWTCGRGTGNGDGGSRSNIRGCGGGYDDAPAQRDEDAKLSEPVKDEKPGEQENSQKTEEITTEETRKTESAGENRTKENETTVETKTADSVEEETTDDDTGMSETTEEAENLSEAETQTQTQAEETDTDETAVNMNEGETGTAKLTNVQACGYYITADLEIGGTEEIYYRLYWKEKGRKEYENCIQCDSSYMVVIAPLKPNTEYVLCLKSGDSDNVYDEQEIATTDDYQFNVETPVTIDSITANSARIHVHVTDYKGAYPNEDGMRATLFAGTEYRNAFGKTTEVSASYNIRFNNNESNRQTECTITVSLDNLKAGTEYTLPVWVSEYVDSKAMRKEVGDVTFTTKESKIAAKVKLETAVDETDQTKMNYTLSLDTASDTEGLEASYDCLILYKIKGASVDEFTYLEENAILSSDHNYQYEGSITGLYTGTDYELIAVVDGIAKTAEFSTETDGMAFEVLLSPLSFGAKMNIALTGVSETSECYRVKAYIKDKEDSWKPIVFYTKASHSSESDVALIPANAYQGEWLAASRKLIGANASYEMRVDLENASGVVIKRKYDTLVTPKISLKTGVEDIAGREATITCEIEEPDEAFDWIGVPAAAKVYYRKKDSDAAWYEETTFEFIKNEKYEIPIRNLDVDTEYEVKITSVDDQDNIYAATVFQTTEGVAEGVLGDVDVHFNGFYIRAEGTFTPSDYAEKTEIRLVECDSAGKVLTQSEGASVNIGKRFYIIDALRMETAKVRIEVTETQKGTDGSLEEKKYLSPEYIREKIPNGTFSIADVSTGASAVRANLIYTGDWCFEEDNSSQRIYASLYYNARGESAQEERSTSVSYYLGDKSKILTFNGFAEDTAYEGKLVVYVESHLSGSVVNVYEQEIKLEEFTTKKNVTYPLEATFPDARFRELIKNYAGLGSNATEITTAQLERITTIYQERRDFDTVPIKDLTGIELLTGLEYIGIANHEVSDVSAIDWSKLMALRNFNLRGNDLTMIPDLSKNRNLREVSLLENVIPAEEFETASAKLPEGVMLSSSTQSSQRVGGVQVIAEETYYQRAGKSPLLIRVSGHKTRLPYEFRYTVDGNALTFDRIVYDGSDGNQNISCCTDTGLAVGRHTLTVEMYAKTEKEFAQDFDFQIAEGGACLEKTQYRFNARQSFYNVVVRSDKPVSAVYMQKDGSAIAAASDIHSAVSDMEYRYQTLGSSGIRLEGLDTYESSALLQCVRSQKPDAGTYDLRVVYEDGTQDVLQGVIALFDKAFVEGGMIGYDCDSTGDSFYLYVMGDGFDASKMEYAFTYEGERQTAEYVNQKEVSGGYIVKFRKADTWTPNAGSIVEVKLTPKDGYEVSFDNDTFLAEISQGIYYYAYNQASNKVEVGVTANLKRENVGFALARYDSREDAAAGNAAESIDVNAQIVSETVSYLVPMKDGAVYKLPAGFYRLDMTCGDYREHKEFVVNDGGDTNYWVGSRYAGAGTGDRTVSFYSEIPFEKENGAKDFHAELTGELLSSPLRAKRVWTYGYNGNSLTAVGMTFDLSSLAQGDYTITLRYRNETLSTYTVTVLPTDKFVITDNGAPYASRIDGSSFWVWFDTINAAESDAYTVTLTDPFGNKVSGLTTEVSNIYSDSVYLKVSGLEKKNAYQYYSVKVTHNTLGEAYGADGTTPFFAQEQGKYIQISDAGFTWANDNNRTVGIGMYSGIAFPVTVKVYQTHDTQEITSVTVNEGDLEKKTGTLLWYYFKQELTDALPDADALYDVVVADADGRIGILRKKPLGAREEVLGEWTVSPAQISLSLDSDESKVGTVTVEGNRDTPVFASDNEAVATVAAERADENKAVVTAVAEGTANIRITVGTVTKTVAVTVVKEGSEDNPGDDEQDEIVKELGTLYFLEGADSTLADIKLPEGWNWEDPTEVLKADNSHPVQDFMAVYNKEDVSFERYLDVYVSKLDTVRIVGKSTVNSGKEALYIGAYTYTGANPANGYDIDWQWTAGENLLLSADTGERITAKVSGNDTLCVSLTVTNNATKKAVLGNAALSVTAGETADGEPVLENKKITIYKNSTQDVPIGLVAVNGNAITGVTADDADFRIRQDENGEWLIGLEAGKKGSYTRKTNKTLSLTVVTESGTEYQKTIGVTVDVTEITAKNVTFKQTLKPNAAYSDTDTVRAEFSVSSKYIIEDITAAEGTDNGKFTVKSYNKASGTLVLTAKAAELNASDKKYPVKVQVKVRDYGTWTLGVNVAVQNKKPSLKLGGAVILKGVNADASVALYDAKTEISWNDYTFTDVEGNGVTLTKDAGLLKAAYTGDRNGTYQVKIRKNTWAPNVELVLKGKISVLDLAKAKLGADLPKITINISEGYAAPVTITAGIQGSSITADLKAEPEKNKDKQAVTAEVLGGGKIRITPKDGAKKGSYKVAVSGTVNGTPIKGLSVKVTLTDKAPEVKLSAKGKINLANREGTSIVYTPTLKNLPETLSIKGVRIDKTTQDSGFFRARLDDGGKVVLTAVTGKVMNPKTNYKPVLIFILSNGKTVRTNGKFTVSVTNRLPKVTVTALSSVLCSADAAHRAAYRLNAGNGYTVSNVTTDDANCKVTFDSGTDTVYVSLSENANVTAGKKYTVSCTVYIKGADNTTKPLTVQLKVVVY